MDDKQLSRWRPSGRQLLWAGGIVALAFLIIVVCGYLFGWKWTGLPKRTLWDWLELLIIPAVLAGGGLWFNRQQRDREIEIVERRAQDEALQAYLDQITQLLLDKKDNRLFKMELNEDVRAVIRARSEAIRRSLDARHIRSLVDFLQALDLLNKLNPIVSLAGYDLRGVDWRRADLQEADLRRMDLRFVNLESANLEGANLEEANLKGANLRFANLWDAFLAGADFEGADLREAKLNRALLSTASLIKANLSKAELSEAHLMTTNLHKTILRRALLIGADLTEADLTEADLTEAILTKADLTSADLTGAILEGATMPNGQKYEDWLKDKE